MDTPPQMKTNHSGLSADLLTQLDRHLKQQLALCDALENIADSLPDSLDNQVCLQVAGSIYPIIRSAHAFEEQKLFPVLAASDTSLDLLHTLDRLHGEHWEDESFSGEITEALREFVAGRETNSEKLGYMLRGFFGGLRRHIAFEQEALGLFAAGDNR